MVKCKSIEEARRVEGVIHIEAGAVVRAYVMGDELPAHCKVAPAPDAPSETEQLKARIAALEALK